MEQTVEKLLCSTNDAAAMLGVGKSKFYQMHSTGTLGPMPILLDTKKMWSVDELRQWVQAGCPIREKWQQIRGNNSSEKN